jgi:hypothetical protein
MSTSTGMSNYVFNPADLLSMGRAYDAICEVLGNNATTPIREAVASYIIVLASMGHTNEHSLRAAGLSALGRNCSQLSTFLALPD